MIYDALVDLMDLPVENEVSEFAHLQEFTVELTRNHFVPVKRFNHIAERCYTPVRAGCDLTIFNFGPNEPLEPNKFVKKSRIRNCGSRARWRFFFRYEFCGSFLVSVWVDDRQHE